MYLETLSVPVTFIDYTLLIFVYNNQNIYSIEDNKQFLSHFYKLKKL